MEVGESYLVQNVKVGSFNQKRKLNWTPASMVIKVDGIDLENEELDNLPEVIDFIHVKPRNDELCTSCHHDISKSLDGNGIYQCGNCNLLSKVVYKKDGIDAKIMATVTSVTRQVFIPTTIFNGDAKELLKEKCRLSSKTTQKL